MRDAKESEVRRLEIMNAAMQLFMEKGYTFCLPLNSSLSIRVKNSPGARPVTISPLLSLTVT